jgi:hypothetical protein
MKASFDNLAQGIAPDQPGWNLPDGTWSDARNVRFRDGAVERMDGHDQALGDLSATALWAAQINSGTTVYWAYGSKTALYATDGSTHANVGSASFNVGDDLAWNGGPYNGYMVANCGSVAPVTWAPALANKAEPLVNFPAGVTCKVIRAFRNFLVALRITDGGVYNPRLMRWGSSALAGALPSSWDYTDPANDSGIAELAQTSDALVDCLPLRDVNFVYKEQHTWLMEYVGGSSVFGFRQVFSNIGMLAEDCAASFRTGHLVLTDTDVVIHDGNQAESVADGRMRRWLFNRISTSRYKRCFVVANHRAREAWVCFPEAGYDWCNLAAVWSWTDGRWTVRELNQPLTFAASGVVPSGAATTFDGSTGTFDEATGAFDDAKYSAFQSRLLMLDSTAMRAYQSDGGPLFGGATPTCYVTRSSLNLGRDADRHKRVLRVFPKVLGTTGEVVNVYVGARSITDGSVSWRGPYPYAIGVDRKVDVRVTARLIDIRFEYAGTGTFRLFGFDVEFDPAGIR